MSLTADAVEKMLEGILPEKDLFLVGVNVSDSAIKPKVTKKVLVVEDEGEMGLVLDLVLTERNIHLDYVSTILGAQEYLSEQEPTVIILDNKLPDGFGVDFITYLKSKYPQIKIIMISGFDAAAKDVAMENGADIYLEKPFTKSQLYDAIMQLLNPATA